MWPLVWVSEGRLWGAPNSGVWVVPNFPTPTMALSFADVNKRAINPNKTVAVAYTTKVRLTILSGLLALISTDYSRKRNAGLWRICCFFQLASHVVSS